jgi:uncharacterized protein
MPYSACVGRFGVEGVPRKVTTQVGERMKADATTKFRSSISRLPRLAAVTVWCILVSACVSAPPTQAPSGLEPLENRARQAEEAGNLRAAMQIYRQLADSVRGSTRAGYLIDAARLALAEGDNALAIEWLQEADRDASGDQRQGILVLRADIDVRESRAANAIARLNQLRQPMPTSVMTDAEAVRGRALFQLGRAAEAVRALVERETWLETSADLLENQRMIWEGLAATDLAAVQRTGDELVDGWLALAPIAAAGLSGAELRGAILDWRRVHAAHPAATGLLAELLAADRGDAVYPRQVALLLPMSAARDAATAIRDGFMAAHLASIDEEGRREMSVRIYDTTSLGAEEAYRRAQLEGAEFVVGPLLRPEVEGVVLQAGFVPTLALNFIDTDASLVNAFWQFALAPEDETRAVARRAYEDGVRTAVALVPLDTTGWGMRLLNSFRAEFEALGGRLLAYNTYDPAAQDFSTPIRTLLNLDRSEQRRTRLAANLGVTLGFEPRRREDADMIFLAAPSRGVARLLAPALRFHFAGDIPTYATSDVYEPAEGGARDGDLNDIYFPDARWLLQPTADDRELRRMLQTYWPRRTAGAAASNLRLYGMGVDAYQLVGALFGGVEAWPLEGLTGGLELDVTGRVHRLLPFAQFRNGRPVALEPARIALPSRSPAFDGEPVGGREIVGAR